MSLALTLAPVGYNFLSWWEAESRREEKPVIGHGNLDRNGASPGASHQRIRGMKSLGIYKKKKAPPSGPLPGRHTFQLPTFT